MKVTKVSVSFARTVNPRPYNPVRTEMYIEAELSKGDDEKEIRRKLFSRIKKDIDNLSEKILSEEQSDDD